MIQKECPLCFCDEQESTVIALELVQATRVKFTYAICGECKSVYLTEVPDDMSKYYVGYYSFKIDDDRPSLKRLLRRVMEVAINSSFLPRIFFKELPIFLHKYIPPNLQAFRYLSPNIESHILDVGSGGGEFVRFLSSKLGYLNASGIDPFIPIESDYVKRSDVFHHSGKYDLIIMNHSFEHMLEPVKVLKKCRELLSKNGQIIVHLPSADSVEFKNYKECWWGLHAPRHFFLPTRIGISNAAKLAGLKIMDMISTSRYDHYLYSEDYSKNIADNDELSVRLGMSKEIKKWGKEKLIQANRVGGADWVAYYLKVPN